MQALQGRRRSRRVMAAAVAALTAMTVLPSQLNAVAAPTDSFATTMPDAALRGCVTTALNLDSTAAPTSDQLATVTSLSCSGKGVADLTGISALPNLGKLFLGNNSLTSLAPLATSTKVSSLDVSSNQLSDITPTANLKALVSVNVANNRLRDLSPLSTLPNLEGLSITSNSQKAVGAPATSGQATAVPTAIDKTGTVFKAEAPSGVTVSGATVTYPIAGTYDWSFKDQSLYFNGTITVTVSAASGVTIPDAGLRGCINDKLALAPDATPTQDQLASITDLSCVNKGVTDLTGISQLGSLKNLTLSTNKISDLTPLTPLTGLESLILTGNSVADVSPLTSLQNLAALTLDRNNVLTLNGLGYLPKLATLSASSQFKNEGRTRLASIAGLDKLTGLTSLAINNTDVSDLTPVTGLSGLTRLSATNSQISSAAPLAALGRLTALDLSGNHISDISPLNKLDMTLNAMRVTGQTLAAPEAKASVATDAPGVTALDGSILVAAPPAGLTVNDAKVTYASPGDYTWTFEEKTPGSYPRTFFSGKITQRATDAPPAVVGVDIPDTNFRTCLAGLLNHSDPAAPISADELAGLTSVICVGKSISNLTGAANLTGATELILSTNSISDVTPLRGLTQLQKLYLPGNKISDPAPLSSLTNLNELLLGQNQVTSISALSPLAGLTTLEISQKYDKNGNTGLTSLDGVQHMSSLKALTANNSRISDLAPLKDLHELSSLYLNNNSVNDLTALSGLTALEKLGLSNNNISSVTPLACLTKLSRIDIGNNHLMDLSPLGSTAIDATFNLNANNQATHLATVPVGLTTSVPQPRDMKGAIVPVTPPAGLTITDGTVTYPKSGTYSFTWTSSTGEGGKSFSGSVDQEVGAAVIGAANVPDAALRSCLASAAGLDATASPTVDQLKALTTVKCASKGITNLTGVENLTAATTIDLSGNTLADVTPLAGLDKLATLNLSHTGLSSLTTVSALPALTALTISGNPITDLSALKAKTGLVLQATDMTGSAPDVKGGVASDVPTAFDATGTSVPLGAPAGATVANGKVTCTAAGSYSWPFTTTGGAFSGTITQKVTSDATDPDANKGAQACVQAGNVWVVVERDTGLQKGGCATKFSTDTEALTSAGFTTDNPTFVGKIDGYPATAPVDDPGHYSYWTYWHGVSADPTATTQTYPDVPSSMAFSDDICWLTQHKIATGWPDGTFRPVTPLNRDAMVAFLYRMAGSPAFTPTRQTFTDVDAGNMFFKQIEWAASNGIVTGWPDGTFRPTQPITRDAIAALIYRQAGSPAVTLPDRPSFNDVSPTTMFYREIEWMQAKGIANGWADGSYRPLNDTNRDAIAAFLHRATDQGVLALH